MMSDEIEKGPPCRQADETYKECVERKVDELIHDENMKPMQAIAVAGSMCDIMCSEKDGDPPPSSRTPTTPQEAMSDAPVLNNPTIVSDESKFDGLAGSSVAVELHYRIISPFDIIEKGYHDEDDERKDGDVQIRGPIYVGSDDLLDRHGELVEMGAIMDAWTEYSKNPVILYNHSKTYGVIGQMKSVTMGDFNGIEVPFGTAVIDGGEKDIVRKINKGFLKAFSIGFIARAMVKECEDEDSCFLRFTEIDWLETSIVDVPASPDALFSVEKSIHVPANIEKDVEKGCGCGGDCCDDHGSDAKAKEMVEIGGMDAFTSAEEAINEARKIGCVPPVFHTIWDEKNGRTLYLPCRDRAAQDEAEGKASSEKEMVGPDIFTDIAEAEMRANELKCGGYHTMWSDELEKQLYMPCNTHDEYLATLASEEVDDANDFGKSEGSRVIASLNNPLVAPVESMTAAEMDAVAEIEAPEEAIEEPVEAPEVKEAPVEEVQIDEAPTEIPKPLDVLIEVATSLKAIDDRLSAVEATLDPVVEDDVEELKAAIAEKDEELATLAQEKATAEAEAAYEAEITERVKEVLATYGIDSEPERKSLPATDDESDGDITRFDPQPEMSKGMNGLATWLGTNLSNRG